MPYTVNNPDETALTDEEKKKKKKASLVDEIIARITRRLRLGEGRGTVNEGEARQLREVDYGD